MASFHKQLVLNQWLLGFFKGGSLAGLKIRLGEDRHEGIDDDGQTGFFHELTQNLFEVDRFSDQELRRYDLNIVQHWNAITERRNKLEGTVLNMKYFQYLSLLFTEIYLDWYFNKPQALLDGLNEQLKAYNKQADADNRFQPFNADELNKLAFWNATGSGKTLLLHVNIRQYLHYFQNGKDTYPDKIILLTPNEGLSRQHLAELNLSGFGFSRMFDKNRSGVFKGTIEIIDINKLGDEMGDKTVAVEAFEGKNLVLVDEGHRGTGTAAGAWMSRRETLVRGGFAFEYSATFGQAVAKGFTVQKAEAELMKKKAKVLFETTNLKKLDESQKQSLTLTTEEKRRARTLATREVYAKGILFDYSYKFFYEDGYGKESLILNLKDEDFSQEDIARQYFTACLLSFYQQQYKDNQIKGFKRTVYPWLYEVPAEFAGKIKEAHITLDLYPKLEALASQDKGGAGPEGNIRHMGKIASETMALFDFDRIYLAVQEFKQLRSWSNLRLDRARLMDFCLNHHDWYTLFIPKSELSIRGFADVLKQEEILIRLLQDYTDRFYKSLKSAYEGQFYDIVTVKEDDDTLLKVYQFEIEDTEDGEAYEKKLKQLQALVRDGKLGEASQWNAGQMVAICFDSHLYYPLFAIEGAVPLKMRPLAFDAPSEIQFVRDLEAFYQSPLGQQIIGKRSLYLLRNADTKAKGLGFALAGNFYPDYLLWLVDEETGQQCLNFIDPKGIRQMNLTDPKLGLYKEVKVLQDKLGDPKLTLNAFILSGTAFGDLLNVTCKQQELEERNVLFMDEGGPAYLKKMFERTGVL